MKNNKAGTVSTVESAGVEHDSIELETRLKSLNKEIKLEIRVASNRNLVVLLGAIGIATAILASIESHEYVAAKNRIEELSEQVDQRSDEIKSILIEANDKLMDTDEE